MNDKDFQTANELIEKYGSIYINTYSTDCDGCSSASHRVFKSVEDLIKWIDKEDEWCDGSWYWEFTTPDNLTEIAPHGYWGM